MSDMEEKTITLPHTITLREPIEMGKESGTMITEITFRNRFTAAMVEKMPVADQTMGDFYPVISKMTGETMETIRRLGFRDLQECIEVVSHFFGSGPTIGGK